MVNTKKEQNKSKQTKEKVQKQVGKTNKTEKAEKKASNINKEADYWLCDSKKCKKCKYRMKVGNTLGCSYLVTVKERRKFEGHECFSFCKG